MKRSITDWLISKTGGWLSKGAVPFNSYLVDFESLSYEIRPADVLLIEGHNRISTIIRQVTYSPWTHAALYIGRLHDIDDPELRKKVEAHYHGSHGDQLVIETLLGKGTIVSPLKRYQNHHIRICRPQGLSRMDAQKVIGYAITHLGRRYNVRHILDLARFLFPYGILPRRWRSTLFLHNALQPTEDICSSLIAEAFLSVDFPVLPVIREGKEKSLEIIQRNPKIYIPSDFDYSPYFSIIKYPYINLNQVGYYSLPWEKGKLASDQFPGHDVQNSGRIQGS